MVPNIRGNETKASILQKTSEYLKSLKSSQATLKDDIENYKNKIEILNKQVSDLQNELPVDGIRLIGGNINDSLKFNAYVQKRTAENWKFYIFSKILKPIFESYTENINIYSNENFQYSLTQWQKIFFNLVQLRPSMFDS